eukprot:GEZU01025495.1.p1 GENE.GEZU01025495.1~~GEZU01025495.1.p1  ORF type:complete len:370 (+),score=48.36 GEZU01025495.1:40-1149(+)
MISFKDINNTALCDNASLLPREDGNNRTMGLPDVEFFVGSEKKKFYAHKNILSLRSTLLESKLHSSNVVEVPSISPAIFRIVLRYIYTGSVDNFEVSKMSELYAAAMILGLHDLRAHCDEWIRTRSEQLLSQQQQQRRLRDPQFAQQSLKQELTVSSAGDEHLARAKFEPIDEQWRRCSTIVYCTPRPGRDNGKKLSKVIATLSKHGGGKIILNAGAYRIMTPIKLASNVSIQGVSREAVQLLVTGPCGIDCQNVDMTGIVLSDFMLIGNNKTNTGILGGSTMQYQNSSRFVLRNLTFTQFEYCMDRGSVEVGMYDCLFDHLEVIQNTYGIKVTGTGTVIICPRVVWCSRGVWLNDPLDYYVGASMQVY